MQLEGSSKRKRSSSSSYGRTQDDVDHLTTDERLPLTELPVGQSAEDGEGSDSDIDWACDEAISLGDEEDDTDSTKIVVRQFGERKNVDENVERPRKLVRRTIDNNFGYIYSPPESDGNTQKHKCNFANITELMNFFKRKGRSGVDTRSDKIFSGNPGLQPKMRSVLLEWIVEVCDVYKLHRETYHLTVDYLDRYLCQSENISKGQLQLIGVTALLIAAKYEEIYPPKVSDFAYITDGACTDKDIIKMESLMMQVLEWRCTVITSNTWVLGCLQLLCVQEKQDYDNTDVTVPLYNHTIYDTVMHLLDLCSLDCGFVKFPYKVLALSGIHTVLPNSDSVILKVSGYAMEDLAECMYWMQPYWILLCEKFNYETVESSSFELNGPSSRHSDLSHMKIKHNIDLDMLEAVQLIIGEREKSGEIAELLLTPPSSSEKRKGNNKKGEEVAASDGDTILVNEM